MNYYKTQQVVQKTIPEWIKRSGKDGASINRLVWEISLKYPTSQKFIRKQIDLMAENGLVEVDEDTVTWKGY